MLIVARSNTSSHPWCSDDVQSPYIRRMWSLLWCMIITHHWSAVSDIWLKNTIVKLQNSIGAPQPCEGFVMLTELVLYPFSLFLDFTGTVWTHRKLCIPCFMKDNPEQCQSFLRERSLGSRLWSRLCASCPPLSFDSSLPLLLSWPCSSVLKALWTTSFLVTFISQWSDFQWCHADPSYGSRRWGLSTSSQADPVMSKADWK